VALSAEISPRRDLWESHNRSAE